MTSRRTFMAIAATATLGFLVACTTPAVTTPAGATGGTPSTGGGAAMAATVKIKGFKFDPIEVHVKKGGTVTWMNEDTVPHDASSIESGKFKTATLSGGKASDAIKFDTAGSFDYFCSLHPTTMKVDEASKKTYKVIVE